MGNKKSETPRAPRTPSTPGHAILVPDICPPTKENSEIFEPMELSTQKSTSTDVDIYTFYLQTFKCYHSQEQFNTNEIAYLLPIEIGILLDLSRICDKIKCKCKKLWFSGCLKTSLPYQSKVKFKNWNFKLEIKQVLAENFKYNE